MTKLQFIKLFHAFTDFSLELITLESLNQVFINLCNSKNNMLLNITEFEEYYFEIEYRKLTGD